MKMVKILALLVAVAVVAVGGRLLMQEGTLPRSTGEAAIGGPFTLVDGSGRTVTEKDFLGRYTLIYFGYTFCPDVCPTSLQTMAQAMGQIPEAQANKILPVFITIDPERDSPEHVGEYVKAFHPRMLGLSGSPEQVSEAAKAYKVYFAKAADKDAPADTYLMDHSSIVYLMGPDGKFLAHFGHGVTVPEMAETLTKTVK